MAWVAGAGVSGSSESVQSEFNNNVCLCSRNAKNMIWYDLMLKLTKSLKQVQYVSCSETQYFKCIHYLKTYIVQLDD